MPRFTPPGHGKPINGVAIDWDAVKLPPPSEPPQCPFCDTTQKPEALSDGRFLCPCCSRRFVWR